MASISTGIGLITGMDITGTVDKLMAIAAKSRDLLKTRTTAIQDEQAAVTSLAALLTSVRYMSDNLGKEEVYTKRNVTSSDGSALTATANGQPPLGTYSFTPVRAATSQQWLSGGLLSDSSPLGTGKLTLRFGSNVERDTRLEGLGGGAGFTRGKIRITDRSGASAEIDLSTAQTLDDVLTAINDNATINVTATISDGRIRLTDDTGQAVSNLKVQEVSGGKTAASLGLTGIDASAATADGQDMWRLFTGMSLDELNDGRGVRISTVMPDIEYHLRDGTTGTLDLSPILPNSSTVDSDLTLGDIIDRINAVAPDKLRAEIDVDGRRLKITDLTTGSDTFSLTGVNGSQALHDLGLDASATDGTIVGDRILSGAGTVLLSSLDGGRGLGALGSLQLTDRQGASATVDLSAAETLVDVITAINSAGLEIEASVNAARNGLQLVDTSGATSGQLIVASAGGSQTAEKLGIAAASDTGRIASGDLRLQIVAENTKLSALNGGAGIGRGNLTIQDSIGAKATVDLSADSITTVGDVLRAINRLSLGVRAEINDRGDGLRLVDTARGSGEMKVTEGNSTSARDLGLLNTVSEVQIDGQLTKVIDGTTTRTIELTGTETLQDLTKKINALGMGVSATTLTDGSSRPYRMALVSERSGRAGELTIESSIAGLNFDETVAGQNALLLYGASGMLVSSTTNQFKGVVNGVNLEVKQGTGKAVTVTVATSTTSLTAGVKSFVDNYNKFRDKLLELTKYDIEGNTRSVLSGDATALRLDTDLSNLLSRRIDGAGKIRSLAEIGITIDEEGKLELDESKLTAAYAADADAVQRFFATADTGFSARMKKMVNQLAADDTSMLSRRIEALDRKVTENQQRLDFMQVRLDTQRVRLLTQFYNMEIAIGKLKNNLTALDAIQPLTTSSSSSSS